MVKGRLKLVQYRMVKDRPESDRLGQIGHWTEVKDSGQGEASIRQTLTGYW